MTNNSHNHLISFLLMPFLMFCCQFSQEQSGLDQQSAMVKEDSTQNQ